MGMFSVCMKVSITGESETKCLSLQTAALQTIGINGCYREHSIQSAATATTVIHCGIDWTMDTHRLGGEAEILANG